MEIENVDLICLSIMDDTVTLRSPRPGDRFRSEIDLIEAVEVSELLRHPETGKQDYYCRFRVVEVYDPNEMDCLGMDDLFLLYGDVVVDDTYVYVEE